MQCQWDEFIHILPMCMRKKVDDLGRLHLQELRLRIGKKPELVLADGPIFLDMITTADHISHCINVASQYSPWSASTSQLGYITAPGGHRIGICGIGTIGDVGSRGVGTVTSICIRIARDFPNISGQLNNLVGSVLIIGPPGCGKTTLLRDLIRKHSDSEEGSICVIDERGEIFPMIKQGACFPTGCRTDVLTGITKKSGINLLIRCMSPKILAIDEITAEEDCIALSHAGWCGVRILATAHAASREDLHRRLVYAPLLKAKLFDYLVILRNDKTWTWEKMEL